jgi:hypothetical protein
MISVAFWSREYVQNRSKILPRFGHGTQVLHVARFSVSIVVPQGLAQLVGHDTAISLSHLRGVISQ